MLRAAVATLGLLAIGGADFTRADEPSPTPPPSGNEQNVTSTVKGLETLRLMEKGLVAGDADRDLSAAGLLSNASLDQQVAVPLPLPVDGSAEDTDEAELRELRRRQWAAENWLVDGMRRSEVAGDEAALTAETFGAAGENEQTADGEPEAVSSQHWLALAIQSQAETQAATEQADAPAEPRSVEAGATTPANPLGDFMADWLTADSKRLLDVDPRPVASGAGADHRAGLPGRAEPPAGSQSGNWLASLTSSGAPTRRGAAADGATDNPFLAGLESLMPAAAPADPGGRFSLPLPTTGAREPSVFQPILPEAGAGSRPAPATLQPPADRASEKVSEPWQPPATDSEKYFPRLKRF